MRKALIALALILALFLAAPSLGFGAEDELPERLGGLEYSDTYDQTAVRIDVFVRDEEGRLPGRPPMTKKDIVAVLSAAR